MTALSEACSEARAYTSIELDEELSELDAARLSAHLDVCPACMRWAERASAVALLLREAELEQPARMYQAPLRLANIRHARAVAGAAASIAALALAVVAVTFPSAGRHPISGSFADASPAAGITCPSCDVARAFVRENVVPPRVRPLGANRRYPDPT